jgi:hypothetical protein
VGPPTFSLKGSMTALTIHASKDGESIETVVAGPTMAVAKARTLSKSGWQVHITDSDGRVFQPDKFDQLLSFDHIRPPIRF